MVKHHPNKINAREAAYLALLASLREEKFLADSLQEWNKSCQPSSIDLALAQEIAYGSCQKALSLDYLASQLSEKKKLAIKLKERALLRTALYQQCFMSRIPPYAIADESIKIAQKHCHAFFVNYLNALLRRLAQGIPALPDGDSIQELSIRYSYPIFFIQELIPNYGLEKTKEILAAGNTPAPTMFRIRPQALQIPQELIVATPCPVAALKERSLLEKIASSRDYYIQNATPASLIGRLCQESPYPPKKILDLCAAPGGKLIAAHDFFPEASLWANDRTEEKMKKLSENLTKYEIKATLSSSLGENYQSSDLFDLIILDVPCSNSGVLNKRHEARWRLTSNALEKQAEIQFKLLANAKTLLAPQGELWYLTCSILPKENQELIGKASRELDLSIRFQELILPNSEGWDGGFASALTMN